MESNDLKMLNRALNQTIRMCKSNAPHNILIEQVEGVLEYFNPPPNQENTTGVCAHDWETMSGKIEFVEECSICGERR